MASQFIPSRSSVNDLWAQAAAALSSDDKLNINFNRPDKLNILAELHTAAENSRQRALESRWRYIRKSGEAVIMRDVFEKIIRWVDLFKQVGDVAVQYDPGHASLPWAGVRFVLQIVVNDINKHASIVEGLARIAELICRFAIVENLYLQGTSEAAKELERTVVKLYSGILGYLSKARRYLEQGTAQRTIKSAFLTETQLDTDLNEIQGAENDVHRCMALVDRNESINNHTALINLLTSMDAPLRRMDADLKNIHDNLQASKRAEIVRWLSPEPYMQHHKQTKRDILAGTGQWLLSDPIFKQWKDDSASSILWLHGIPGSGKSKLVATVVEDTLECYKAGNSPPPVFFYCSRNPAEPTRSDSQAVLASLARQLSCLQPGKPLMKPMVDLYREKEEEGFASGSLEMDECLDLVLQLTAQYPLTTIVIDAMDECNPQKRHKLLEALEKILHESSSLVKIFVSSRNDQDIVLRLQHYPNLEIDSRRNSDDIARFVHDETERLIKDGKLLRYSTCQADMKVLIVEKVVQGAAGMFRWASLQLQYLCSFRLDSDMEKSLGKLPPDLHELYAEIYEMISSQPGEDQATIFKNVLHWLLCAQRTLTSEEFLCVVSIEPKSSNIVSVPSKELVLEICSNFIVFDAQLDTFRFAHLSVREFLEKRPEHNNSVANALAAEVCLWTVLSASSHSATKELLTKLGWQACIFQANFETIRTYADIYWAPHCKLAKEERKSGSLRMALRHVLSGVGEASSAMALWISRLSKRFGKGQYWAIKESMKDMLIAANSINSAGLFASCAFDFDETMDDTIGESYEFVRCINQKGRTPLLVAVVNGSCASLAYLLELSEEHVEITEVVVKAAAENSGSGEQVMALLLDKRGADMQITKEVVAAIVGRFDKKVVTLLLDKRGADIQITEAVVKAAAENEESGEQVMALLLDKRGADVQITEAVVKAAAENNGSGKQVMALLLDKRGADVQITEAVVKAAAENNGSGKQVMALLLDKRGADVQITEAVVKAAAGNYNSGDQVMALLLDKRGADVQITEEVVQAATINYRSGDQVMALLLDRRGADIQITEEVVAAIVRRFDKNVVTLLLDKRGADIQITEAVVKAAARNYSSGKQVMALLLDKRGADVQITEAVVEAAAGNSGSGKQIMALLLDKRGADVQITEAVVKAAAENNGSGKQVMALLLYKRGADIQITDAVIESAATSGQETTLRLFDLWAGTPIVESYWIHTAQLCAAAKSGDNKSLIQLVEQGIHPDQKDIRGTTPL
ncbi:hypothetical protein B0J11DRAFT_582082 [Dendryphion nanum]|uniref:NACHT domain-containing protein n=1 Tax=Dendryphion nanum TaxID=256645 RepID=A0A9P9IHA0_9PLEO|nr:hypothetical protein B0J11DRAFT_582082 [Dendryphion nanum]